MTIAEKNYKRDYCHKDGEELALNYTRDGMKEELNKALSEVSTDDLSEDEKEYLDGRKQCRNHTLNIRFNDTEWERISTQADALHMKKSSYVRDCIKAHYVLMIDKDDMNELLKHVRGIATNVNQVAYRVNSTGNIYGNPDSAKLKYLPSCTKQQKYGKIEVSRTLCEQHLEGEIKNAKNRVCCKR